MTATKPHARRGRASSTLHSLTRATPIRAGVLLAVVVVCSGSWWDPREWVGQALDTLMSGWARDLAQVAESMLLGAFDGSVGTLGNAEWTIATVFTGRLGAVMGVFAVAFCAIEVIAGMAGRDPMRIFKGAAVALLAWPITATAAWATIKLTNVSDSLSTAILSGSSAEEVATRFFVPLQVMLAANPAGGSLIVMVFALFVLVPTLLLSLVMAFRSFGLLIAVAFAPVALMTQGWAKMRGMARGWATIVGALLVTKPLAAGVIIISLELLETLPDVGALIMGTVGLWMAAFAPAAAAGLFNFAGGEVAAAQGVASAQAGRHMVGAGKGAAKLGAAGARKAGLGAAGAGSAAGAGAGAGGGFMSFMGSFGGSKGGTKTPSGGGGGGAAPTSGGAGPNAAPTSGSSDSKQTPTSGQRSSAPAPATTSTSGDSRAGAPVAVPAAGGQAPATTAPAEGGQAPAAASAANRPGVGPARPGGSQAAGAGGSVPGGTTGAQVPLGAGGAGPDAASPGGAPVPLGAAAGGSAPVGAMGGQSVSTTAGSGANAGTGGGAGGGSSPGSGAGGGSGTRAGSGSGAPAPGTGGGVSTSGGRHTAPSGAPDPAVTGMGGVSSSVVDATVDAVTPAVDVAKSEDSK